MALRSVSAKRLSLGRGEDADWDIGISSPNVRCQKVKKPGWWGETGEGAEGEAE